MLFASTFLKSFSFDMNVNERVYVLLAFHASTPGEDSTLAAKRIGSSTTRSHILSYFTIGPSFSPGERRTLIVLELPE